MFYLLIAAFLWGTSFIAAKFAYNMLDPALVVALRLIISSIILIPITLRYRNKNKQDKEKKHGLFIYLILLGLLTYPITFLLQFIGLSYTSASSAATMIGIEPLMVIIIGIIFFKEKPQPYMLFLGLLAFMGVFLVVGISTDSNISFLGCFLVLLSTIVVAFWLRLSKKIISQMNSTLYTALTIQLGTVFGLPIVLLLVNDWSVNVSVSGITAILYLSIGCSLFAAWCWNKGLAKTPANMSGIFLALEPVFGVLLSILLLNENLTATTTIGILMVILSTGICLILPKNQVSI